MKKNLDQWLAFFEANHPTEIDMGLARVQTVAQKLDVLKPAPLTLLIAGTNGKGSTVTMCSSILTASGMNVGSYMSPHLHVYNERVRINGQPVSDELLIESFEVIDKVRGEISLTYFEVGTLSALYIFKKCHVDAAVLEIGLGGRLDAVNIVEPDGAAVTSIGLDHQDWLGSDIDSIAFEKAGVYRPNQVAVCGERNASQRLVEHANAIGAHLLVKGQDFDYQVSSNHWTWQGINHQGEKILLDELTIPTLPLENAATALQLLLHVCPQLTQDQLNQGLKYAQLEGRLQTFAEPYPGIMDVGHNPQAATLLNKHLLAQAVTGKRYGLLAMLKDKDASAVVECMTAVDAWHVAGLSGYRGQTAAELREKISGIVSIDGMHQSVNQGLTALRQQVGENDQVVIFGSFMTVANAQDWLQGFGHNQDQITEVEGSSDG